MLVLVVELLLKSFQMFVFVQNIELDIRSENFDENSDAFEMLTSIPPKFCQLSQELSEGVRGQLSYCRLSLRIESRDS